jgi:hypothetical protein
MGDAMSKLVERAIDAAGLGSVLSARREGGSMDGHVARLRAADLLALGALADRVRAEDVGADVRIYTDAPLRGDTDAPLRGDTDAPLRGDTDAPPSGDTGALAVVVLPREGQELTGLDLLREVAIARITASRGAHVRIDWTRCGLELAQVALGFGADELLGFIATKRGLPIADDELAGVGKKSKRELAQVVKRRELASYVERGGRVPVFIRADGSVDAADAVSSAVDESPSAVDASGPQTGPRAGTSEPPAEPLKEAM